MTPVFYPRLYDVKDMDHARRAVVGNVDFADGEVLRHEDRWEIDTVYTIDFIVAHLPITANSVVLDYGCGMGRVARELIVRFGCRVIGVDSSESMRRLAVEYVDCGKFYAVAGTAEPCDFAICLWVLQHCPVPEVDIENIKRCLKPGGRLLVFNDFTRNVPVATGFAKDDVDVAAALRDAFGVVEEIGQLDADILHPKFCQRTFWAIYRNDSMADAPPPGEQEMVSAGIVDCLPGYDDHGPHSVDPMDGYRAPRIKLNLGCAFNHMDGAENVDINPTCKPDRVVDLEKFPWPWADGSVDEICMYHSLEHIGGHPEVFLAIMRELYRVLKPGGEVHIQVPHPRHDNYINSPTHVRPITSITLQQFSLAWNKQTRKEGYANETFAELLGIDFKITENQLVIAKPWWEKYQRGMITKDELEFAVASYWNVIEECRITIEKVPLE